MRMLGADSLFVRQLGRDGVAEEEAEHERFVVQQTAFRLRLLLSRGDTHLVMTLNLLLLSASFMKIKSSRLRW